MVRKLVAEFLGTAILVIVAVGAAVGGLKSGPDQSVLNIVGVALAFGLVLLALAYSIGGISGCHINPAVTIAMMATRRQSIQEGISFIAVQFLGALAGAGLLKYLVGQGLTDTTGALGSNSTATVGTAGSFITEVVLTFIFVGVILLVTKSENVGFVGLTIGLALAAVHLVGIPITGTSVNPARSFGPAILTGGSSLTELWVFIAAPLVGGLIAAIVMPWMASHKADA